jgi:uncharacterized protein (DUF58 family)
MKALRVIFYLLMPVFLFAGLYTGLRIWYFFLIAQLILVLFLFALNQWTLRTFAYTQTLENDTVEKGQETALHLSIRNEKPFPLSMMRVDVEMAAPSENTQISFSLLPFAGQEFDFRVSAPYRGVYPIGITAMRITDVLGLLPQSFDMRKLSYYRQPQLTVYPRAEAFSSLRGDVADEKLFGERYLLTSESGSSIAGARAYRPGDPLKQIHWKKSAQRGELYVKQYEQPVRENLTVLIDNCAHGAEGEDALARADTVCEAAACITLHCLRRNRSAVLRALGDTKGVRPEAEALTEGDVGDVRRWLAQLPFGDEAPEGPLPLETGYGASSLIVVTHRCTESLAEKIAEAEPYFSAVTLVLVGEGHGEKTDLPSLRLEVGCDVASALAALE